MAIPSYAEAITAVRSHRRVTLKQLTRDLGVEYPRAQGYLEQMELEGIVSPVGADGSRTVIDPYADADQDSSADPGAWRERHDQERLAALEAQIARLKASGRTVIAQREEWKARALAAEGKLAGRDDGRYAAVKRLLAREFHPDGAPIDGVARSAREAMFKHLWPKVEALERGEE